MARNIALPRPLPVASHSTRSAPLIAAGRAILAAANSAGRANGSRTPKSSRVRDPPYADTTSHAWRGALRIAVVTATSVGKNVTSPTMTVTHHSPRPKMSAISGVIAMIGTDRNAIAVGITTASRNGDATTAQATSTDAARPRLNPTAVSTIVVPNAENTLDRSSLTRVRNRQTSPGRLAKYGFRSNSRNNIHHAATRSALDAIAVSSIDTALRRDSPSCNTLIGRSPDAHGSNTRASRPVAAYASPTVTPITTARPHVRATSNDDCDRIIASSRLRRPPRYSPTIA